MLYIYIYHVRCLGISCIITLYPIVLFTQDGSGSGVLWVHNILQLHRALRQQSLGGEDQGGSTNTQVIKMSNAN